MRSMKEVKERFPTIYEIIGEQYVELLKSETPMPKPLEGVNALRTAV